MSTYRAAAIDATAPALHVSQWLNTPSPVRLESLRGRVVALHAFQMLCPACVTHALPQATQLHKRFSGAGLSVIGLHTVFEHHEAMTAAALKAFVHEYHLAFPIGIDEPDGRGGVPLTMQAYALRGTPSLVLIDRAGSLRLNHFGHIDDLSLGALLGQLLSEAPVAATAADSDAGCSSSGCPARRRSGGQAALNSAPVGSSPRRCRRVTHSH